MCCSDYCDAMRDETRPNCTHTILIGGKSDKVSLYGCMGMVVGG